MPRYNSGAWNLRGFCQSTHREHAPGGFFLRQSLVWDAADLGLLPQGVHMLRAIRAMLCDHGGKEKVAGLRVKGYLHISAVRAI